MSFSYPKAHIQKLPDLNFEGQITNVSVTGSITISIIRPNNIIRNNTNRPNNTPWPT